MTSPDADDFDLGEAHPMSPFRSWLWHVWQDLWYGGPRLLPSPDPDIQDDDWDDDPGGDQDYPR
jgi:hypothetical protein